MPRDNASLLDIVQAAQRVLQFASGLNREELGADVMRQSAILYQIAIMGEATKRLSREFRILLANSENLTPQPPSLQGKGE